MEGGKERGREGGKERGREGGKGKRREGGKEFPFSALFPRPCP